MSETVTLHGGPRNGQKHVVPFPDSRSIEIEVEFDVDGKRMSRRGKYTRVHTISETPTSDFEWSGYVTAFTPSEKAE